MCSALKRSADGLRLDEEPLSVEATPSHGATSQGSTTMGFIHTASRVSMCCVGGCGGQACCLIILGADLLVSTMHAFSSVLLLDVYHFHSPLLIKTKPHQIFTQANQVLG